MRMHEFIAKYAIFAVWIFSSGNCFSLFIEKPDCKKIVMEHRQMADTTILNYGDYDVVASPSFFCAGKKMDNIFAVPEKNSVGTNDLDNAISLLHFNRDSKLKRQVVKKNFMEMTTGPFDFCFLPVWSEKEIAYTMTRGFLIFNIPEKKAEMHTIINGFHDIIANLFVLDGKQRVFAFEIDKPAAGIGCYSKILRIKLHQ